MLYAYGRLHLLDPGNAAVDEKARSVHTDNSEDSNLHLLPLPEETLKLSIVKGKGEEPVQGWSNDPWRPVPTAICTREGKGVTHFLCVLYPTPRGVSCPVTSVSALPVTAGVGLGAKITFADGRAHAVIFSDQPGTEVRAGDLTTHAEVALFRLSAEGKVEEVTRAGEARR